MLRKKIIAFTIDDIVLVVNVDIRKYVVPEKTVTQAKKRKSPLSAPKISIIVLSNALTCKN